PGCGKVLTFFKRYSPDIHDVVFVWRELTQENVPAPRILQKCKMLSIGTGRDARNPAETARQPDRISGDVRILVDLHRPGIAVSLVRTLFAQRIDQAAIR